MPSTLDEQLVRLRRIYIAAGQVIVGLRILLDELEWKRRNGGDKARLDELEQRLSDILGDMHRLRRAAMERAAEIMARRAAEQFLEGEEIGDAALRVHGN